MSGPRDRIGAGTSGIVKMLGVFAKLVSRHPSNSDLKSVFANAVCAKVYDSLLVSQPKFLVEVRGEDLRTLSRLLEIVDDNSVWFAKDRGDFMVEIIQCDDTSTKLRHLGNTLRHPSWLLDGVLKDGAALRTWLTEEKGVTLGEFHSRKEAISRISGESH